jgi:hypothetical protein
LWNKSSFRSASGSCICFPCSKFSSSYSHAIRVRRSRHQEWKTSHPQCLFQSIFANIYNFLILNQILQVMLGLACAVNLDRLPCCREYRWQWFSRYCLAARVSSALIGRYQLPQSFRDEVQKKIKEISGETEDINLDYEQPEIFSQACDEQLLKWLNR